MNVAISTLTPSNQQAVVVHPASPCFEVSDEWLCNHCVATF